MYFEIKEKQFRKISEKMKKKKWYSNVANALNYNPVTETNQPLE